MEEALVTEAGRWVLEVIRSLGGIFNHNLFLYLSDTNEKYSKCLNCIYFHWVFSEYILKNNLPQRNHS